MKTITVELKQHTPMVHFQHDQCGATLRASDVKPKLDRYLLDWLGGEDEGYEAGLEESKENGWLVGNGEHPALDYKIKIVAGPQEPKLTKMSKDKMRKFPMLLTNNINGIKKKDEMIYFSMHKNVTMYFSFCGKEYRNKESGEKMHREETWYEELQLDKNLPWFFAHTNFGQRSNKGFGSFTVSSIVIDNKTINTKISDYIKEIPYLIFTVKQGNKEEQITDLFTRMKKLWEYIGKRLKDKNEIKSNNIDSTELYIKCMKETYCQKNYKNKDFPRLPSPIMFKPLLFNNENGDLCCVNVLPDESMLQRLRITYESEIEIDHENKIVLTPAKIGNMNIVEKIIKDFYNE